MLTTKLLVRLLKIAVLLIFPVIITGLAISIFSGVICMLSGVNFYTITSSALMIIFGVVSYIMVLIFTGDAIDN
jgi:hypothetical protein